MFNFICNYKMLKFCLLIGTLTFSVKSFSQSFNSDELLGAWKLQPADNNSTITFTSEKIYSQSPQYKDSMFFRLDHVVGDFILTTLTKDSLPGFIYKIEKVNNDHFKLVAIKTRRFNKKSMTWNAMAVSNGPILDMTRIKDK